MDKQSVDMLALVADFQQTFGSPHGKKVLHFLMERSFFLNTSYTQNDPYTSAYNEGQRSIIITILHHMKKDLKQLEQDLTETKGETDAII